MPDGEFESALTETSDEIVFIAGGEIGPIEDLILKAVRKGIDKKIRLFYGANSQKDLNGYGKLQDLAELTDNFDMVRALNCPNPEWDGEVGLITDVVQDLLDAGKVNKCFIYGTEVMVEETRQVLTSLGVPQEKIHQKSFQSAYSYQEAQEAMV